MRQELITKIATAVRRKHPWCISQERFVERFGELPQAYLEERLAYDTLLERAKTFKLLHLVLSETKIEVRLTLSVSSGSWVGPKKRPDITSPRAM